MLRRVLIASMVGLFALSSIGCTRRADEDHVRVLDAMALTDENYVRWLGRTHYDEIEETMQFYHVTSGFEVRFFGTELTVTLHTSNTDDAARKPYFVVTLGEQSPRDGITITPTQDLSTITLVTGLDEGYHTVRFLKRSESVDAMSAVSSISTDGYFVAPEPQHATNLLLIGGSGISGRGVLGAQHQAATTSNSNPFYAFGYLLGEALEANVQFVAARGWGLKWGYNPTNQDGLVNIRAAFDVVGIDDQHALVEVPYDFGNFVPDYIVINLGGNDFAAHINALSPTEASQAQQLFQQAVIEFVNHLHDIYPNATIFWTHTGAAPGQLASAVLSDLDPRRDFVEAVTLLGVGADGDPIGAANHATYPTHLRNATILYDIIQSRNQP